MVFVLVFMFMRLYKITEILVFSGHPVLSDQLSEFRISFPLNTAIFTSIEWSPLLSGCSQLILSLNRLFLLFFSYLVRSLKAEPFK